MKKYLFLALAAMSFAACTEKIDDNNPQTGELEESYIAINLMSADLDTRAATDSYGYEEGTTAERAIKTAYFFFFDAEGNAFNVTGAPATAPGGSKNHLPLTINGGSTSGMENVSDIKNAVLVLSTYKGVYPSQIVAVLNWTPDQDTYSLTDLHELLATLGNDANGYVMSNSVYMDGAGKMVDAVPVTTANIKTSEAEALAAPVDIYVERVAAKVILTAQGKVAGTENIFDTQKNSTPIITLGSANEIDVYVKLHGWELFNDYKSSNLLKNISTSWDVATLGLTWNDIPYYRSYWAESQDTDPNDTFTWEYNTADQATNGFTTAHGFAVDGYTYCGENTNPVDGYSTKVILKGQLMQKNGENYEPLELARWYGTEYAGNDALRTAVANSLKYTLYYKDGENYYSIRPEDLQYVAGATVNADSYKVGFQLSSVGEAKTWYQYNSVSGYVVFGDTSIVGDNAAKANVYLASVEPAVLYTSGMTYYTVDIEHLGTAEAKYGVVRNHVYQIDVQSIKGYGSPVYSGLDYIIDQPQVPEDEDDASYVAARINVLSWKVVKQGVDIVQ